MTTSVRRGVVLFLGWSLCLGVSTAPGCQKVSAEDACVTVCDCTGCDEDDCVEALTDAEDEAKDEKCEDDYQAYVECIQNKLECDDDRADFGDCDDEEEDLADCIEKENMPFYNPCGDLKRQCRSCDWDSETEDLCVEAVDLIKEIGGEEACEEALDEGGVQCGGEGGGGEGGGGGSGGGTTASATAGSGTTGSGTTGSGTPTGCDTGTYASIDSSTCTACIECSFAANCADELAVFQSAPGAQAYIDCIDPCTTDACFNSCANSYPAASNAYINAVSCAVCVECPYNCDAATNCS
jgi:hypothetical protein